MTMHAILVAVLLGAPGVGVPPGILTAGGIVAGQISAGRVTVGRIAVGRESQIVLLAAAEVRGETILLTDLLPKDGPKDLPDDVRAKSEKIFLGTAPQYGIYRALQGSAVAEAIRQSGISPERFQIPGVIYLRRIGRALEGEEVMASIYLAIGRFTTSPAAAAALRRIRASDCRWEPTLLVGLGDARLTVEGISVDLLRGEAEFRMGVDAEPHRVPFTVFAQLSAPTVRGAGSKTALALRTDEGAGNFAVSSFASLPRVKVSGTLTSSPAAALTLIKAGQQVQLWLHSENSSILVQVTALQAGDVGETIRVRMLVSGSTLRARVVGPGQLEATF